MILRTLKIAALVTAYSVALGYPLAYFLVFTIRSEKLRTLLYMCVVVPLWVSYLLRAYTWKIILGTDGALNSALLWLGLISEPLDIFLYNQAAMVITLTYIFIPFMVMPIFTALERIPANLIEASQDLGACPSAISSPRFWWVVQAAPWLRPFCKASSVPRSTGRLVRHLPSFSSPTSLSCCRVPASSTRRAAYR